MKATVSLSWNNRVVVSPHIGEMDSPRSLAVFEQVVESLQSLYDVRAERVVCDAHPGYTTHRWATQQSLPVARVWHHRAHASALAGESSLPGTWLVFTWDGVGLGEDGNLWGGEALIGAPGAWTRVASMRPLRPPGGDRAGREPWRSAAAVSWECGQEWAGNPGDELARAAWERGINCPPTSAVGRLFDAAAALVTGQTHASFEAQGPMYLENLCGRPQEPVELPIYEDDGGMLRSDWRPLVAVLTDDRRSQAERAEVFHASLAHTLLQQARRIGRRYPIDQVGLCGGVFQNRVLADTVVGLLEQDGFRTVLPEMLPCGDAALSFGQAVEVAARSARE